MAMRSWIPPDIVPRFRSSRFLRYLIAGGINTALCFAVFTLLIVAGVGFAVANSIAWLIGVLFSFFLSCKYVYYRPFRIRLLRSFFLSNLGALILSNVLLATFVNVLGVNAILAWLVTVPLVVIANYWFTKSFVFSN